MKGLLKLLVGGFVAAALPLSAQSYASSFSAVAFDRAKGPGTFHGMVKVDDASGSVSASVPMGPGIGERGLKFVPTLSMRLAPVLGIKTSTESFITGTSSEGLQTWGSVAVDTTFQREWGSSGFTPGYFDLALNLGGLPRKTSYQLPSGPSGSAAGVMPSNLGFRAGDSMVLPSAMTTSAAQALIAKFGYTDQVAYAPGQTDRTTKAPFLQMGTGGELIVGLRTTGAGIAMTDEASDWIQEGGLNSGGYKWDWPRRILVISGDTATEFQYVSHHYDNFVVPYLANAEKHPLKSVHYIPVKVSNRFSEAITFTHDADALGYTATWMRNGTGTGISIRVAYVGQVATQTYALDGSGTGPSMGSGASQIRVSYQGLSQPIASYLLTACSASGGGLVRRDSTTYNLPGQAMTDSWDIGRVGLCPLSVTRETTTPETISFAYGTTTATTWYGTSTSPTILKQVVLPTRTISLDWTAYPFRINWAPHAFAGYVGDDHRRPGYVYGVTAITDGTRKTTHTRVLPTANWATSPSEPSGAETWVTRTFYDAVTNPDGTTVVHRYVEPGDDGVNLQTLAHLKHVERESRAYAAGVDWKADIDANTAPTSSTAFRIVSHDRYDTRTLGNPNGVLALQPTPYPTRTRTWDKEAGTLVIEERTGWDATNNAWQNIRKVSQLNASPDFTFLPNGAAVNSVASTFPTTPEGDRTTTRTYESDVANWFLAREKKSQTTNNGDRTGFLQQAAGATIPAALPPAEKVFDGLNRVTDLKAGDATALQVVTHLDYASATGPDAAKLQAATLSSPQGLALSGSVGASYGYDALGFMNTITQKPNATLSLTVQQAQDGLGRPTSQTDANGKTSSFSWDAEGRLTGITPPDAEQGTTITYDTDLKGVTVTRGTQVTQYRYNVYGDLVLERRKDATGAWSHRLTGYDAAGRKTAETVWASGQGDEANWSAPNLTTTATITTTTPGYTRCVQWGFDADGNRVCTQEQVIPDTTTTTTLNPLYVGSLISYDARSRVATVLDASSITTTTAYAGWPQYAGPTKIVTVAPGTQQEEKTTFESDALGRLVRVTDALNQVTVYKYDEADRITLVQQTDPVSAKVQTRTWAYNGLGWVTSLVQPESGTTSYSDFTVAGKPQTTSYAGRIVRTTYDWMGRPLTVKSDDLTVNQTLTYDEAGKGASLGKLTTAVDGTVTRILSYAGMGGRPSNLITRVTGFSDLTQTVGYDTYGNPNAGNTSHGAWTQTYDAASGVPALLKLGTQTVASTPWDATHWDLVSWQPKQIDYGNGVKSTFDYYADQARLKAIAHLPVSGGPNAQWTYDYDPAGNLIKENDLLNGKSDRYGYDKLNRLISAVVQSPTYGEQLQTFAYDAFGNRIQSLTERVVSWSGTTATTTATTVPTIVNASFTRTDAALSGKNQLPATTSASVATGALYDAQGNLTRIYMKPGSSNTQLTLTYDALGRVTQLSDAARPGFSEKYSYTNEGLRTVIEEYLNGTLQKTRINVYDGGRRLVAQYEKLPAGTLTWKRDILYLGTREAAEFDAAGMHVTQVDHLGSPRVVTGPTGTKESSQKYMPYGELLEQTGTLKTGKGYTGHEQTETSGLIYMQARFYLPTLGRFMSPDPARDQHFEQTQSWNIYSYVRNSPILHTDPTGLEDKGVQTPYFDKQHWLNTGEYRKPSSEESADDNESGEMDDVNAAEKARAEESEEGRQHYFLGNQSDNDFGRLYTPEEMAEVIDTLCKNPNFKQYYDLAVANGYSFESRFLSRSTVEMGESSQRAKKMYIDTSQMSMGVDGRPRLSTLANIMSHELRHVYQYISLAQSGKVVLGVYANGKDRMAGKFHYETLTSLEYDLDKFRSYSKQYAEKDATLFGEWIAREVAP